MAEFHDACVALKLAQHFAIQQYIIENSILKGFTRTRVFIYGHTMIGFDIFDSELLNL